MEKVINKKSLYRRSRKWRRFRKAYLQSAGPYCELCGQKSNRLQLHHVHPENYGHEQFTDVAALCYLCHRFVERLIIRKNFKETQFSKYLDEIKARFTGCL
jgi:CRISPR/Cas system-associated protein Cas10 (large subunit of type III CRISPR-Cas system)